MITAKHVDSTEAKNQEHHSDLLNIGAKFTSLLGVIVSLVTLMLTLPVLYNYIKSEDDSKIVQYEKLRAVTFSAANIIAQWNQIEEIESNSLASESIRENIQIVLQNYSEQNIDKLSDLTKAVYNWHFAKLYNIRADMISKHRMAEALESLNMSRSLLLTAEQIIRNSKFSAIEKEYITENNILEKIERTHLVTLALMNYLHEDELNVRKSNRLLTALGGCERLINNHLVRHKKILKGLQCSR